MHILVYESAQTVPISLIPAGASGNLTTTLQSPWIRPRLEGNRTATRGDAWDAKLADWARVQFTVRVSPGEVLNNFQALLTIYQSPLLGQDPEATFPNFQQDVSGAFAIDGKIAVDLALEGTSRVELELTRVNNPPPGPLTPKNSLFALCQITAEERSIDAEYLQRMRDFGEG